MHYDFEERMSNLTTRKQVSGGGFHLEIEAEATCTGTMSVRL